QLTPLANDLGALFDAPLPHYGGAIDGDAVSGVPGTLADLADLSPPLEGALVHLASHSATPFCSRRHAASSRRLRSSAGIDGQTSATAQRRMPPPVSSWPGSYKQSSGLGRRIMLPGL